MAEKIEKDIGLKVELVPGKVGELSVYWKKEKISNKGDPIEDILERLNKKRPI